MGLFICDLCNKHLDITAGGSHVCNQEDIRKHVEQLELAARTAERNLDEMQNAVLMILKELPSLEGEKVQVNAEWLRRLWGATKNQWYDAKTADDFLVQWMVTHRILCEAYDVFRSKKYGHSQTLLQKLTDLREACDNSKAVLGYKDSHFDMSPEDLAKGVLHESEGYNP